MVLGAVIFTFKMQIIYHVDSQTWTTWILAFLPTKFHLKYYFTGKTCQTRNSHFTVLYKEPRTHLCYTNVIFVNCIYFLSIGREKKKKRCKRQAKVLLWQFLKFSILCLPFCLLFLAFEIFLYIHSLKSSQLGRTNISNTVSSLYIIWEKIGYTKQESW